MRPSGSPQVLEERRRLAVTRVHEGYDPSEVAEFLNVDVSSVYRWLSYHRQAGEAGLKALAIPGRPPKLTSRQTHQVVRWLRHNPEEFGFPTPRWTAPRLASLITHRLGVQLHPRYLNAWLHAHGISPQIPACVARERDPIAIMHWIRHTWPRI